MKKTFFTLIEGGKVRVGPETKIIPAKDIGTLLEAQEIVEKVDGEVGALKQQVMNQCEQLKKQAYREGYQAGQQVWVEHVAALEKEIQKVNAELRDMVIPVALKAAKKIVGREMKLDSGTIVDIVANNLRAVASHQKVVIYVNKDDYDTFQAHRDTLAKVFERLESLVIQERKDVQPNGCVIETEAGIINAQLDNQWEMLQQAFESVLGKEIAENGGEYEEDEDEDEDE